jgi:CelD/BcsL family acetyltransferase involved in cellulose biosynthesis
LIRRGDVLASAANWHSPIVDFLTEGDRPARALADAIFAERPRRLAVAFPDPAGPGLRATRDAAAGAAYRILVRLRQTSPYVEISGPFGEYESTLNAHLRANVRRRRRRLEERGDLSVDVVGGEQIDEALAEGFRIEGSGWKAARGTAIESRPETRRFYTAVAHWAATRGNLQLAFLRLGGRPIAFHYNLLDGRVLYHLKGGYDPEFARYSPSTLLHREMLARAFAGGVSRYEFLGHDEPWKREWARATTESRFVEAFSSSPYGTLDWAAHRAARRLVTRARALQRRRASAKRRSST